MEQKYTILLLGTFLFLFAETFSGTEQDSSTPVKTAALPSGSPSDPGNDGKNNDKPSQDSDAEFPLTEEDSEECSPYFVTWLHLISVEERRALRAVLTEKFTRHENGNFAKEIRNIRAYLEEELDAKHKRERVELILKKSTRAATKRSYKTGEPFCASYLAEKEKARRCLEKWRTANENKV